MKIIVASESEKRIVKEFMEYLSDHGVDCLPDMEEYKIDSTDKGFLHSGIFHVDVEVGNTQYMEMEDDIIEGVCVRCKQMTMGTINNEDITLDEYKRLTSEEARKDWLCESCMDKY